jgi:hypothetical protein
VLPGWPLLAAAVISPPISSDPMLYLHYGSMSLAGVNPYLLPTSALESVFTQGVVWDQTCVYGPIALTCFMFAALFNSPLVGVVVLKLLWLAAHLAAGYACWRAAAGSDRQPDWLARAFVFNPVLLLAHVVDVHLDVLVGALLLWGLVALAAERALLGLALLALPLWFAWVLSRRRWGTALLGVAVLGALCALLWQTLLPTAGAWRSLANPIPNTGRSIQHALVLLAAWFQYDGPRAAAGYTWLARGAYLLVATAIWLRGVRSQPYTAGLLGRDFSLLLLLACLFVVPFVPWWYSALVIGAALWSQDAAWLRPAALAFGVGTAMTLSAGSGLSKAGLVSTALAIVPTTLVLIRSLRIRRSVA